VAAETDATAVTAPVSVLLVDDDDQWAQVTARLLEINEPAFDVTVATSLSDGRTQFETTDPDCLVCDYQLGDGTGLELLDIVRAVDTDRPFLLLTARGDEKLASQAIDRGVSDYIPKAYDDGESKLLTARVTKAVTSYRTRQQLIHERETKAATLNALTATTDITEIATQFCRLLVANHGLAAAWIGTVDDSNELIPVAVDGCETYLNAIFEHHSPQSEAIGVDTDGTTNQDPAIMAGQTNEQVITVFTAPSAGDDDLSAGDGDLGTVDEVAHSHAFASGAGIPIKHDGIQVGVLGVYTATDEPRIDSQLRSLLVEYAEIIGYAYRTAEWERSLWAERPVHLTVEINDAAAPLVGLATHLGGSVTATVLSTNRATANRQLYLLQLAGATPDELRTAAEACDGIELGSVSTVDSGVRCDLSVTGSTPEQLLAANGAQIEQTIIGDGAMTISVSVESHAAVSDLTSALEAAYDSVALTKLWNLTDEMNSTRSNGPLHTLTQKQLDVLQYAYFDGYFNQPRNVSSVELAEKFDLARSTMTQHMRTAERKVFEHLFEQ